MMENNNIAPTVNSVINSAVTIERYPINKALEVLCILSYVAEDNLYLMKSGKIFDDLEIIISKIWQIKRFTTSNSPKEIFFRIEPKGVYKNIYSGTAVSLVESFSTKTLEVIFHPNCDWKWIK